MRAQSFSALVLVALSIGVLGALGTTTRGASAGIPGDVCKITAWNAAGQVIPDGGQVGSKSVYLVFRVEDDPFGYVNDFLLDGPVQEILDDLQEQIDDLYLQLGQTDDEQEIFELETEIAALEEVLAEYEEAIEGVLDTDLVEIDASTGAARITSQAEVTGFEWTRPNVSHILVQPSVGSQRVDHMFPDYFNDPDGNELDSISDWLYDMGVPVPGTFGNNVCGGSEVDGWGFVDIQCIEAGRFRVNVIPQRETTENVRGTIDLYCPGQADTAEISGTKTLETNPVGSNVSSTTVVVTVWDQFDARLEHAEVTFSTNNCTFASASDISPAGGGTTVTTYTDSDTSSDDNFLTNNPLEVSAGTAEATLDCSKSSAKPGTAVVTAIVQRPGSDIVLSQTYTIVGPTSVTGLTLKLTPDDLECGETILATANAVDSLGQTVSDGTLIYFTTDTSSGVVGGYEGAQGGIETSKGEASVLIATDPSNPGTHTVIAYALKGESSSTSIVAQTSATYTCDAAVAPAAPTVAPPATGTGTGSITPPNTGDAGLKSTDNSSTVGFGLLAVLSLIFSGLGLAAVRVRR